MKRSRRRRGALDFDPATRTLWVPDVGAGGDRVAPGFYRVRVKAGGAQVSRMTARVR